MKDLDAMYSAACIRKTREIRDLDKVLDFINLIEKLEIDEKYQPFEKSFISLQKREDVPFVTKTPFFGEFIVVDKII